MDQGLEKIFTPGGEKLYKFSDNSIQAAAMRILNSLPDGTNNVLLSFDVLKSDGSKPGFNTAIAYKTKSNWSVVVAYQRDWKDQSGTIQVRHSW